MAFLDPHCSSQQRGEKGHISLDELGESKNAVGLMYQGNYWNHECESLIAQSEFI